MGRGGSIGCKTNFKRRVSSKDKESDNDSDEDYVVSDDETEVADEDTEEYCDSVDEYASDESFVGDEENEEKGRRKGRNFARSKARKISRVVSDSEEEEENDRRKTGRPRAMRGSLSGSVEDEEDEIETKEYEEEDEIETEEYEREEDEMEEFEEDGEKDVGRSKVRTSSSSPHNRNNGVKTSRQKKESYEVEEKDDEDYQEEDEDSDEEFTADEDDCLESLDEEEEEKSVTRKKNNVSARKKKRGRPKKRSRRCQKRRRTMISKKPLKKKLRKNRRLKRKVRNDDDDDDDDYSDNERDDDFVDNSLVLVTQSKKKAGQRKRKYVGKSDSDFVPSGSSEYEFTVSEEEREQVRKANRLSGNLKGSSRSTLSTKRSREDEDIQQPRKLPARKGKEKIEEVKSIAAKQVCGICLSEEDKRRLRGILDSCSHFYCFTCIMEWSKVESRCPSCKQRFKTITKQARAMAGVDMRNMVISVPERDQVYQPTEEELRSYIDPYENVMCSECHEGEDDALMLLCDLCDSSAHTYCVGLGRQVPEGNWYCDGCRPVALGCASSQALDPLPDQRTISSGLLNRTPPTVNIGECFDPSLIPSPLPAFNQGGAVNVHSQFPFGDVHAASPTSGAGASTLYGRRLVHRRMQDIFSNSRMNSVTVRTDGVLTANSSNNPLNSEIDQDRGSLVQPTRTQMVSLLNNSLFHERLQDNPSSSLQNMDSFGWNHLRTREIHDLNTMVTEGPASVTLWPQSGGVYVPPPGFEQLNQSSSRPGVATFSSYAAREESPFYKAKEQLQSMVKTHLENLSQHVDLGKNALKEISRSSTHTILAICGLEHRSNEVRSVPPPAICTHVERIECGQSSLMKDFCTSCFDSFVKDIVKRIFDAKESQCLKKQQWLSLG